MISKLKNFIKKIETNFQIKRPWDLIIIYIITFLVTIPTFLILHHNLVNLNLFWHLDRIFIFALLFFVVQFCLTKIRKITFLSIFIYLIILFLGSIFGSYGVKNIAEDYQSMLFSMNENPFPQDIMIDKLLPFPNKSEIKSAIDFENPKLRNFAIMCTTKHFKKIKGYKDYKTIIQCFAVFKEINANWNYVHDPKNSEYYANASESIKYLSGDCDDHSILMAACVRVIGGTPRLIHTDGHIYPEILIGSQEDLETINYLIKNTLFERESLSKRINYHIDNRGKIWLNLDYTARYPGGPFMSQEILGELVLD